jgi:alpha-1,2-mannosyltransferase
MLSAAAAPADRPPWAQLAVVRGLELFVFAALPLICGAFFAHLLIGTPALFDFRTFWQGGRDVLHGHSPYPPTLPAVAHAATFRPFVYPVPAAVVLAPLAALPMTVAEALWVVASIVSVAGALWLLDVRDWRCYGIVFVWPTVWSGIVNGSATPLLVLACAALWRYRRRPYVAGALVALLVVFKLYLWPLAVWLLATRRMRASVVAFIAAAAATLGGWALVGFAGLAEYPHLLSRLTSLVAEQSYSPYAFARSVGLDAEAARLSVLALGGALLVGIVARARREGGDKTGFVLAIAASLALSPIVWPHYWAVVIVVVGLAAPELDAGWLLPLGGWLVSTAWSGASPLWIGLALCLYGLTIVWALRRVSGGAVSVRSFRPAVVAPAVK